jgi:hypothetical protein
MDGSHHTSHGNVHQHHNLTQGQQQQQVEQWRQWLQQQQQRQWLQQQVRRGRMTKTTRVWNRNQRDEGKGSRRKHVSSFWYVLIFFSFCYTNIFFYMYTTLYGKLQ